MGDCTVREMGEEIIQRIVSHCSASKTFEPKNLKLSQCQVQYHLNTGRGGQVWYLNGPNMSGCQMVWILSGGLKTKQQCLFYGLKCLVFKWFN